MLPPAVGVPAVRRELEAAGTRRRGGRRRRARRPARGAPRRPAGSTPSRTAARGARGPMTGRIDGADGRRRAVRGAPTLDPARQPLPRRPPDRRHAGAARRDGHGGLRRGRPRAAARTGASSPSRTSSCWRRSSSTATSRARSSCARWCATAATARSWPTASWSAGATLPGQGEQETVHFTGRVRLAREAPPAPRRRRAPPDAGDGRSSSHDAVYRVYFHGPAYQVLERAYRHDGERRRSARRRPAARPRAAGGPDRDRPAADRAVLPDRGRLGARHRGPDGAPDPRRPGRARTPARTTRAALRRRRAPPGRRAMDADVVDETGRVRVRLEGYRTIALPGPLRERRARADARRGRRADWRLAPPVPRASPIVNRGEAAMRLIHAVRELNEQRARRRSSSIALYTEPERQAMFVREADEAYCLGPATAVGATARRATATSTTSALERALVGDARRRRVGRLGLRGRAARRSPSCASGSGIVFVGPSADVMRRLGDKIEAKRLAEAAGVPVAPWSGGPVDDVEEARAPRRAHRLPADDQGGGGRRRARHPPRRRRRTSWPRPSSRARAEAARGLRRRHACFMERARRPPPATSRSR